MGFAGLALAVALSAQIGALTPAVPTPANLRAPAPTAPTMPTGTNAASAAATKVEGAGTANRADGEVTADAADAFYPGKVVVVSGAQGGVGLALVEGLLRRGATVYAGIHGARPSAALAALARAHAKTLHVLPLDVTQEKSVASFRRQIRAPYVDVVLYAAGVNVDGHGRLLDPVDERFAKSYAVNALGPVRLLAALRELLHNCGTPRIGVLTSVMGSIGENHIGGSPAYRMSKAAANMLVKELSVEEPTLLVLALHPGWVRTKMGGVHADVDPGPSADGLLNVLARATPAQSGAFLRYTGEPIAW